MRKSLAPREFNNTSSECFNILFDGFVEGEEDLDWLEQLIQGEHDESDLLLLSICCYDDFEINLSHLLRWSLCSNLKNHC